MKIVLLKQVQGLGQPGDIKEVAEGYARNYLIPRGWADILTKHSLGVLQAQQKKREKSKQLEVKNRELQVDKLDGQSFVIQVKADDKGSLYAKLDAKAIARVLAGQGWTVASDEVELAGPIKQLGEYEVGLKLAGQRAKIKLAVTSNKREGVIPAVYG